MSTFGGLQTVWLMVMFDLPTTTPEEKRRYQLFHGFLLDDGYCMMQYSVYIRHCASSENATVIEKGSVPCCRKKGR